MDTVQEREKKRPPRMTRAGHKNQTRKTREPQVETVTLAVEPETVNAELHTRMFALPGRVTQLTVLASGFHSQEGKILLIAELFRQGSARLEVQQNNLTSGFNNLGTFKVQRGDKLVIRTHCSDDKAVAGKVEVAYNYER